MNVSFSSKQDKKDDTENIDPMTGMVIKTPIQIAKTRKRNLFFIVIGFSVFITGFFSIPMFIMGFDSPITLIFVAVPGIAALFFIIIVLAIPIDNLIPTEDPKKDKFSFLGRSSYDLYLKHLRLNSDLSNQTSSFDAAQDSDPFGPRVGLGKMDKSPIENASYIPAGNAEVIICPYCGADVKKGLTRCPECLSKL